MQADLVDLWSENVSFTVGKQGQGLISKTGFFKITNHHVVGVLELCDFQKINTMLHLLLYGRGIDRSSTKALVTS